MVIFFSFSHWAKLSLVLRICYFDKLPPFILSSTVIKKMVSLCGIILLLVDILVQSFNLNLRKANVFEGF